VKKFLVAIALLILCVSTAQAQKLTGAGATFLIRSTPSGLASTARPTPASRSTISRSVQAVDSPGDGGACGFWRLRRADDDEQLAASKVKLIHIPRCLARWCRFSTFPRRRHQVQRRCAGGYLPGQDYDVERRSHCKGQSWRETAGPEDHRGSPFRRQRHHYIWTDYLSKVSSDWASGPARARRRAGRWRGWQGQ